MLRYVKGAIYRNADTWVAMTIGYSAALCFHVGLGAALWQLLLIPAWIALYCWAAPDASDEASEEAA